MLTTWDDFPVHQTSAPVAQPVSGDPAHYERYYALVFDHEATTHAGFGISLHPNRGVIDAAFSIAKDGRQEALFASGPLPSDRSEIAVGPFRVEILEPMRSLRILVEEQDGLGAELRFNAQSPAIAENRLLRTSGIRTTSDRTRFVQFGDWTGNLVFDGKEIACSSWPGVRDRSWGVRRQGTAAEAGGTPGSIYAIWSVMHFHDRFVQVTVHEDEHGRAYVRSGIEFPQLTQDSTPIADITTVRRTDSVNFDIDYVPDTRRPSSAILDIGPRGGLDLDLNFEPRNTFQMKGLGYYHPVHAHGTPTEQLRVHREGWTIADLDPLRAENVHAQQLSVVRRGDGARGVGIFEHVAIGPHLPSGLPAGLAPRPAGRQPVSPIGTAPD